MKKITQFIIALLLLMAGLAPITAQAVSSNFTAFPRALAQADIDFDTVTLKVMLASSAPSEANLDAWVFKSDVTNEITGTGYTAGGIAQAFTLNALDTANNRQAITLTNITNGWTTATFSAVGAYIYADTGTPTTSRLIAFVDFGGTISATAGNYSITYTAPIYINR